MRGRRAYRTLLWSLLFAGPMLALAFEEPLSFLALENPEVRFFWGNVPKELRERAMPTGDFSNIEPEDYLGPQSCEPCHKDKYRTWSEHRHRWMNAPANEATIRGNFEGGEIRYFGGRAGFVTDTSGRYLMKLKRGALKRTYEVTQTIGSRFFQYYVGRQIEGPELRGKIIYRSEHVLPFGYWMDDEAWVPVVHVEKTREGEPSLVDAMRRDPYADPAVYDYARSCSQCHTTLPAGDWLIHRQPTFPPSPRPFAFDLLSYVEKNHHDVAPSGKALRRLDEDEAQRALLRITSKKAPVWKVTSGVSCETCHYGNRAHVESGGTVLPRMFPVSEKLFIEGHDPEVELARNPINQNWTCSRCHLGDRFEFAAGMGTWNSTEFSDLSKGACFLRNDERSIRCVDCHNPHVTTGRAWSRPPDEDDGLCLKCHEELRPQEKRIEHTHHLPGSSGSRCMNCHMPRINEGLQDMVRTHMIFSPTHAAMIEGNQPNACNMCHVEKPIDWTLDYLDRWYGRTYSEAEMAASYDPPLREGPATLGWLESWHPTTQMVAMDVLTKTKSQWALPHVVDKLDSPYMLMRQFTLIGLEEWLDIDLEDYGYRFYMFEEERGAPIDAIRRALDVERTTSSERVDDVRHFRQFVRMRPDSANAHYHLANALVRRGELDTAIEHYRRALSLQPHYAEAENNLGIAYRLKGDVEEALRRHERALTLDPELADAHVALGNALMAQGRSGEALRRYREALRKRPGYAEAHYNLGLALHAKGETKEAIEQYRRALESKPDYVEVANNLGIALQTEGDLAGAIEVFRSALASGPGGDLEASLHNNLGWTLKLDGKLDDAGNELRKALEGKPDSLSARVGLAWILASHPNAEARRPEDALLLAESANAMTRGESVEVLDVLAAALAANGRFDEAVETAERALSLAGKDESLVRAIRERLTGYRAAEPFLDVVVP